MTAEKPFLFIDIDGVLNRYRAAGPQFAAMVHHIGPSNAEPSFTYRMVLDPANGPKLLAMAEVFDLAWGTTWEHDANLLISPIVGLPTDLPVAVTALAECSKAPGVARLAGGRPFVRLDDDLDTYDRALLADYPAPWLIVDVDPNAGLSDDDLAQARRFAQALSGAESIEVAT